MARSQRGVSRPARLAEWTCSRCAVTARFMPGSDHEGLPDDWIAAGDGFYCLGCRRVLAGEAAVAAEAGSTRQEILRLRRAGTLEFELTRDPDRTNNAIAHACHTSVPAVAKARATVDRLKP